MAYAVDDVHLGLHRPAHRVARAPVAHGGRAQGSQVVQGKERKPARQQVASRGPCVLDVAVIDLQAAHCDDEHAVGEHHGRLREEYLGGGEHTLQGRPEHALVVHACRELVPRAQQAGEHQRGEERALAVGETECHQHERQEYRRLQPVDGVAEVPPPPYPRAHEGLQRPGQEQERGTQGGPRRRGPALQEHEQSHKGHHGRGYLLRPEEGGHPRPW